MGYNTPSTPEKAFDDVRYHLKCLIDEAPDIDIARERVEQVRALIGDFIELLLQERLIQEKLDEFEAKLISTEVEEDGTNTE